MTTQQISLTISLPSSTENTTQVSTEVARPLEPYSYINLPPPQTQQALRLSRQIGVCIATNTPITLSVSSPPPLSISSPPLNSTHPTPIHHPHSPPPLNIPTSLPQPIPREPPNNEKEFLREHLHKFISHCHHELDILEGRRALTKLYKDDIAYEAMSQKYEKMWTLWEESRKLFQLLSE